MPKDRRQETLRTIENFLKESDALGGEGGWMRSLNLRRLQKIARDHVLHRDLGKCLVCGSRDRVEAAYVVHPPSINLLSRSCEDAEQFERDMAPFFRPENMVLLCRLGILAVRPTKSLLLCNSFKVFLFRIETSYSIF